MMKNQELRFTFSRKLRTESEWRTIYEAVWHLELELRRLISIEVWKLPPDSREKILKKLHIEES